ncbi:hypothetical protein [Salegentibacter maritimus]|uniref:hypothetical protein n=1 Tax=Salegentibacter maritimus TaxID=2794347 RepID=UPI0018E47C74|nr:hypothetical protein [Salegentibacter maritimus]MBI6118235.1 hypothetical protein [Salegentibacter maritimus]
MIVEFDIYQSILKPLRIDSEELKKEFLRSQRALTNLGKLDLKIFDTKSSILEVKEYVRVPKLIKELWKHHKVYMRDEVIYRFRIKIEYDENFMRILKKISI